MTSKSLFRCAGAAALSLCLFLPAVNADAGDNPRRDWYKKYDYDNDGQLKGKEARTFRKDKEKQHAKLHAWCDKAKEKPKKFDVNIPKNVKEKKVKCKKHHIDAPYMKAWVRAGAPEKEESEEERDGARAK